MNDSTDSAGATTPAGDDDEPLEPDTIVDFDDSRVNASADLDTIASGSTPEATLDRLHTVSFYLDEAFEIPGTNYRIGLDPLLGLVPGIGDATAAALSAYILVEAAMLGVPRATLARMFGNILLDSTVGSLPLVGDVFDAVWKANARNVRLLEARYEDPSREAVEADRRFLIAAVVLIMILLVALGVATTLAALWILGQAGLL
ncbi:DUF4112 domain-containing protein [Haloferax mediterranei ATCC 33500]|uniref:DUF4112 domain-containing protein n=1 Tax=Haloferax mediterranei (strain ATCC 33500 / DSM 1411 / JCM 8866 / NBRC 14739 / NCIMB 2177 / R-4) TaxID=523841 RepID=I3R6A9_HALMT|nr:DUF4112 domain-containing protein [Haloferax mediterranei]AFK19769.1 hypothetical protein HFX_2077 [Haloferax mediterranei ATCC 33500]AHZ23154.1 hypothetical protein BM92_11130 [Haloferax mediterranei ATCC 33500]EMA00091.1 hypothetical protein C439_12163 [Haloferax mediterranei ATCC 33500]MDX5987486.1 DUF4112 domain-containing protein [Haloferax mediterranei ATCC 33500]QCQ73986.1 DUF4112 domain-containing protein [Haloferax mediterranei ATCC 33500]